MEQDKPRESSDNDYDVRQRVSGCRMHYVYDYGTQFLRVSSQVVLDQDPQPEATVVLKLQEYESSIRQEVAIVQPHIQGNQRFFRWGEGLHQARAQIEDLAHRGQAFFVESLQRWLCELQQASRCRPRIEAAVSGWVPPGEGFEWLLSTHLRHVREAARRAAKVAHSRRWSEAELNAMEVLEFYAVPDHFEEAQLRILADCIQRAGFEAVRFISETAAAGAWILNQSPKMRNEIPKTLSTGSTLVVVNGGCLRTSIVAYEALKPAASPLRINIAPMDRTDSGLPGSKLLSEMLVEDVKQQLVEQHGGRLEQALRILGLSEDQLNIRIAEVVEQQSLRDLGRHQWHVRDRSPSMMKFNIGVGASIEVDVNPMYLRWLETSHDIATVVNSMIDSATDADAPCVVVLTGGFFRNNALKEYVIRWLRRRLRRCRVLSEPTIRECSASDLSVVKGGILRFKAFEAIPPLVFSLGMMASEPYDPKVHPFMLRDLNEEDPSLVLRSPNNGKHWLRACWRELVVGGTLGVRSQDDKHRGSYAQRSYKTLTEMVDLITEDRPYLDVQVYVARARIPNNMLTLKRTSVDRKLEPLEGIECWGPRLRLHIPWRLLENQPFQRVPEMVDPWMRCLPLQSLDDAKENPPSRTFTVTIRIEVEVSGVNVHLGWQAGLGGPEPAVQGRICLHDASYPVYISLGNATTSSDRVSESASYESHFSVPTALPRLAESDVYEHTPEPSRDSFQGKWRPLSVPQTGLARGSRTPPVSQEASSMETFSGSFSINCRQNPAGSTEPTTLSLMPKSWLYTVDRVLLLPLLQCNLPLMALREQQRCQTPVFHDAGAIPLKILDLKGLSIADSEVAGQDSIVGVKSTNPMIWRGTMTPLRQFPGSWPAAGAVKSTGLGPSYRLVYQSDEGGLQPPDIESTIRLAPAWHSSEALRSVTWGEIFLQRDDIVVVRTGDRHYQAARICDLRFFGKHSINLLVCWLMCCSYPRAVSSTAKDWVFHESNSFDVIHPSTICAVLCGPGNESSEIVIGSTWTFYWHQIKTSEPMMCHQSCDQVSWMFEDQWTGLAGPHLSTARDMLLRKRDMVAGSESHSHAIPMRPITRELTHVPANFFPPLLREPRPCCSLSDRASDSSGVGAEDTTTPRKDRSSGEEQTKRPCPEQAPEESECDSTIHVACYAKGCGETTSVQSDQGRPRRGESTNATKRRRTTPKSAAQPTQDGVYISSDDGSEDKDELDRDTLPADEATSAN